MLRGIIASDVDGTLIRAGEQELPHGLIDQIRELREKNFAVVVASGRDYASLRWLFAPIRDQIHFISTNGSQTWYCDTLLNEVTIPPDLVKKILGKIQLQNVDIAVSQKDFCVILRGKDNFRNSILDRGLQIKEVNSFLDLSGDVVNIMAYAYQNAEKTCSYFQSQLPKELAIVQSGPHSIDIGLSDKGTALAQLALSLQVEASDIIAFGDHKNDLSMLRYAGRPYIMRHADESLRVLGFPMIDSVQEVLVELIGHIE